MGGAMKRDILEMEMKWIYNVKSYSPYSLNIDWDVNVFINNARQVNLVERYILLLFFFLHSLFF